MNNNEEGFYKIIYETMPIGKERITLKLFSLDLDAFDRNETNTIPFKEEVKNIEYNNNNYNEVINDIAFRINCHLIQQYNEMKSFLENNEEIKRVANTMITYTENTSKDFISKSKIKDKIDKLFEVNKELHMKGKNVDNLIYYTIDVLKSLLKEE